MAADRKRKRQSPGKKFTVIWLAVIVVFILELFTYAWCRVESTQAGYTIEREHRLRERQMAARKNLAIELAHLKSPDRIKRLGKDLGLAPPTVKQIKVIP